jgi:TRAP-type C4-dicarboxylate transport system permease small subunit
MRHRLERKLEPLAPMPVFIGRLVRSAAAALALVGVSLAIGVAGYHWIGGFRWIDALLNASMLLGGMGPMDALKSDGAKIFASIYALYSGFVLIALIGILLTPIAHRVLHRFHLEATKAG